MKKVISVLLGGMLCSLIAYAEDSQWLTFKMTDGTEVSVEAADLIINYNAGKLLITGPTVDRELIVAELESMQFTSEAAGLKNIIAEEGSGNFSVYTASGMEAGSFSSINDVRKALPSGVYIIRSGEKSFKIIF